jgi:hypothetical protein
MAPAAALPDEPLRYSIGAAHSGASRVCAEVRTVLHRRLISVWTPLPLEGFPAVTQGTLRRTTGWKHPIRWTVARGTDGTRYDGVGFAIGTRRLLWSPYYGEEGTASLPRVSDAWWAGAHGCAASAP